MFGAGVVVVIFLGSMDHDWVWYMEIEGTWEGVVVSRSVGIRNYGLGS